MGPEQRHRQSAARHYARGSDDRLSHRGPDPHVPTARVHAKRQHQEAVGELRPRSPLVKLPEGGPLIALAAIEEDPAKRLVLAFALLETDAIRLQGQGPRRLISAPTRQLRTVGA